MRAFNDIRSFWSWFVGCQWIHLWSFNNSFGFIRPIVFMLGLLGHSLFRYSSWTRPLQTWTLRIFVVLLGLGHLGLDLLGLDPQGLGLIIYFWNGSLCGTLEISIFQFSLVAASAEAEAGVGAVFSRDWELFLHLQVDSKATTTCQS